MEAQIALIVAVSCAVLGLESDIDSLLYNSISGQSSTVIPSSDTMR